MKTKVHLTDTVAELDARIVTAQQALQVATEQYNFLRQARNILASPLAIALPFHVVTEEEPEPKAAAYGGLKRSVFACLSDSEGTTSQAIVEVMQAQGYTFRSKTPSISVNEALQTLRSEGKAVLAGKSPSGGNLWTKERNVEEPSEDDGQEETPAEAGVLPV